MIFKVHNKDELIDFETNHIPTGTLKLNGYYYTELERKPNSNDNIEENVKYISAYFIYEDGFVVNLDGIDGITNYYCADTESYENTYENAHRTIKLMLEAQNSNDKRKKRICGFGPDDISQKGLVKIDNEKIKIQTYRIENQKPGKDSFNSAYLREVNGTIKSDTTFVIERIIYFRKGNGIFEKKLFKFKETNLKPDIENYFKIHKNRFK